MKFGTKAVHAGVEPDPTTGAIMTPIYQTTTYVQESPAMHKGYAYARGANPTRNALQNSLAALENGKFAICFSSGMGATDAVIKLLSPGDEVITSHDLYGGSYRMFRHVFEKYGIKFHFVDLTNTGNVASLINNNTKLFWLETPTNPLMNIVDIQAYVELARGKNILVAIDNTFASPFLQNPLDLGADIVMHSVTKYIGGHSDVIMGALVVNNEKLHQKLHFIMNSCGAVPGPQDSFLVLRGIKTLHLRMERHCLNGRKIAEYLKGHPKVGKVYWPGFPDHPNHAVAKKQMKDFGGMISFTLRDNSMKKATKLMESVKIFSLAESLGGVESLINHPASMTHASIPKEERIKSGLVDSLIRLSIGVEDFEDLTADLEQALKKV
ncbi:MAG: cystathionine gamma-synthase [Cyclobacteriaceae bacterium]|nr:cystathionine gamma-synthase [Cyclobacteriaceae bacterium]MDH5248091.1 cystathionine gamma-synthase [Cyclobacteriaceae bacterium]